MENKINYKSKNIDRVVILLSIFFALTIVLPMGVLISKIDVKTIPEILSSKMFIESLNNSLMITLISTLLSVGIAFICAYAINRTNMKYKKFFTIMFTVPMLIPSISHGLGLVNLFGEKGIITSLTGININIMGPIGIVLGSLLYSFPVAFLMLSDGFKYIDTTMYEMCDVLGVSKIRKFFNVTLYYMQKPLVSALFAIFTMIFTDYGVPIAVGGKYNVLPVYLYKEVIGLLDFSKGAIIGIVLILPAIISFLYDTLKKEDASLGYVSQNSMPKTNKKLDNILLAFSSIIVIFITSVIGSFIYLSFVKKYPVDTSLTLQHFKYVFNDNLLETAGKSILISLLVAIYGTIGAYICAYITSRIAGKKGKILHMFATISLTIPGIVLGLSFVMLFKGSFIYGTIAIIILVNMIHFFASPYLMAYNALNKVNKNYETIGMIYRIRRVRILLDVIVPCTKTTILEMFSYFFVNSMITISAVAFLTTFELTPISLKINQYEDSLNYEAAAVVSVIILIINVIIKVMQEKFKNKEQEI